MSARSHLSGGLRAAFAVAAWVVVCAGLGGAWANPLAIDKVLGEVRGWNVGVNTDVGACLATARYQDQTAVWFGFIEGNKAFFGLSNPNWRSIDAGKQYKLQILAHGGGRWLGDFHGLDLGDEKSLIATHLKVNFMTDLARAGGLEVIFQNKSIARLSLSGSMAALDAVVDCQKELNARLASEGQEPPRQGRTGEAARKGGERTSSGTGFFVTKSGHIVTNFHVVDGCRSMEIRRQGSTPESVQVIARDSVNDLALLKASSGPAGPVPALAPRTRIGESVYVYGFPLVGLLASSGNFTIGNVTATFGLNDDSRMLQVSAPIQPGNSGGPLMDQHGNIAGVVGPLVTSSVAALLTPVWSAIMR